MKVTLEERVLTLLITHQDGLKSPEIVRALRSKVSQPTLWRTLDAMRARGAVTVEGRARATRYHARERSDVAALRSRRMHESVAKQLIRDPSLRARALVRLERLRQANPHGRRYHDRWYELLQGPLIDLLRVMTEASEASNMLRKESPLGVFIDPNERRRIFQSTSIY